MKATGSGSYDQYLALILPPGNIFICLKAANRVGGVNELVAFKKNFVPDGLTHRVLSLPILTSIPAGTYSFYAIMVPSGADLLTTPMEGWIYDRADFRFE